MRLSCQPRLLLIEPRPLRCARMRDCAAGGLTDQACIFGKGAGAVPRRARLPGPPPINEFLLVHQDVHATRASIDPDAIAVAYQRQRAADEGFRGDVADTHAAGGAGKTAVGDQRNFLAHALPVDQRGDAEHLPHAGTSNRTFIADHKHVASRIVPVTNGPDATLLIFEYARGAFEYGILQARDLDHRAVGTEITLEYGHPAIGHDRLADVKDDLAIRPIRAAVFFGNRLA